MKEVGIYNWRIMPLLTYPCDQRTIREFEKEWVKVLNADLKVVSPFDITNKWNNGKGKGYKRNHYFNSIETKRYYCTVCNKAFGKLNDLKRHLNSLKHSYAYLNSVD